MFNPGSLIRKLDQLGVTPPDALEVPRAVREALGHAATRDVTEDLRAELVAGKITPANATKKAEAAAMLPTQARARDVVASLDNTLQRMELAAIVDNGESIILSMRDPFDNAVGELIIAREVLGPDPDKEKVLGAGPTAAAIWGRREEADRTLALVRRARMALSDAGYGPGQREVAAVTWFLADVADLDDLDAATATYNGLGNGLLALSDAGRSLRLNTPEESTAVARGAHAVTEAIRSAEQDQRDAAQRERREQLDAQIKASETQGREMLRQLR